MFNYVRNLSKKEYLELDSILSEFYGYIKSEMIARNDFTKLSVEMCAMGYLESLFLSIKSFEIIAKKISNDEGIKVEIKNNNKLNDDNLNKIYDVLKKYFIFVTKSFKSIKDVNRERAQNLAEGWLKDYLRINAYKITALNI